MVRSQLIVTGFQPASPGVGACCSRRCRKAGRRRSRTRKPYRLALDRLRAWVAERLRRGLVAAAGQRPAEAGAPRRRIDAPLPGDHIPVGLRRQGAPRTLDTLSAEGPSPQARAKGRGVAGSRIPLRTSIHERSCGPSDRSRFGEWEADGVIGVGCSPHTEVERRTRFLMARIVPGKTARESVGARFLMFSALPAGAGTGVTHDDGTESARHAELRERLGMATYFADPYSSYRRGGNENRNGAIHRHLPKRTRIDPSMTDEIQAIVDRSTTVPCACSATAPRPRHSPTNCHH